MTRQRSTGLIVPVEAARPLTGPWAGLLPAANLALPPHITALWPFLPAEAVDDGVEREIEALVAGAAAFDFALARLSEFPDVVFLSPEPAEPFVALTRLLWRRWPECPPFGGAYPEIVPHLTVALDPDPAIRQTIAGTLAGHLPLEARAESVLLIEEDADGVLRERRRFALGGRPKSGDRA